MTKFQAVMGEAKHKDGSDKIFVAGLKFPTPEDARFYYNAHDALLRELVPVFGSTEAWLNGRYLWLAGCKTEEACQKVYDLILRSMHLFKAAAK